MIISHTYKGIDYILSNENLKVGDKVYPISRGRTCEIGHIHYEYDFRDFMSGFPEEPHVILDLHHSDYKPYEIRTDHGYGPIEMYYKIIASNKKEDYIVDRIVNPKNKQTYVRVMDKISRSVHIVIGPKKQMIHLHWSKFLTKDELNALKAFRTKEINYRLFQRKEHELVDILEGNYFRFS